MYEIKKILVNLTQSLHKINKHYWNKHTDRKKYNYDKYQM